MKIWGSQMSKVDRGLLVSALGEDQKDSRWEEKEKLSKSQGQWKKNQEAGFEEATFQKGCF